VSRKYGRKKTKRGPQEAQKKENKGATVERELKKHNKRKIDTHHETKTR
jgi:hypothetical protein